MTLLSVRGLTKRYGTRVACENVSFDVHPGEVVGIVGESGSGKSTVLQCVYLDAVADAGSVALAGEELTEVDPLRRRWLRSFPMGLVQQGEAAGLAVGGSARRKLGERLPA